MVSGPAHHAKRRAAAIRRGVPEAGVSRCSKCVFVEPDLFDHLVGATEERERDGQAKRLGGF